jgi:hypothetical protein
VWAFYMKDGKISRIESFASERDALDALTSEH